KQSILKPCFEPGAKKETQRHLLTKRSRHALARNSNPESQHHSRKTQVKGCSLIRVNSRPISRVRSTLTAKDEISQRKKQGGSPQRTQRSQRMVCGFHIHRKGREGCNGSEWLTAEIADIARG